MSCQVRLTRPPDCTDNKTRAAWAFCWAREKGVKEQHLGMGAAMKEGWKKVKASCPIKKP